MIVHHPPDGLLLAMAAGRLPLGATLVVSAHLEACVQCRARVGMLEAVGGVMLEQAEPHPLSDESLSAALRQIDSPRADASLASMAASPAGESTASSDEVRLPASLRAYKTTRWQWLGPGRRFKRIQLPQASDSSLLLLTIAPGRSVPQHSHKRVELTQVLCGSFDDGRGVFGPGDFNGADSDVSHQPVAAAGATCVCLTWVEGRLNFEGRVASAVGGWLGI